MVAHGLIDAATADVIETSRAGTGLRFMSAAVKSALIDEATALSALATHTGVPGLDLTRVIIAPDVLQRIPLTVAQRENIVPVRVEGQSLVVAMAAPNDARVRDEVTFVTGLSVIAYVGLQARIKDLLAVAYRDLTKPYKGQMAGSINDPLPIVTPLATEPAIEVIGEDVLEADLTELTEANAVPIHSSTTAKRIVVVEDDPDIQRLVVDTLRSLGAEVSAASRGVEGLQLIKSVKPDLIVLDAMLPEVHGFEICRKIKESKRFAATPVLMLSAIYRGWRIAEDIKATYRADAFLEKPFRIAELRRVVEELLATGKTDAGTDDLGAQGLAHYAAGVEAYQSKDYRTALEELRAAEAIEPFSAKIQFMLGRTLEQDQKVFQAIYHYERAIELDPKLFAATKNLALLYQARGFRNKAVEMWERSLAAAPNPAVREQIKQYLVSIL